MAITAFLSRSPGLLNRGPGDSASLGHGPHYSIFSPTNLNFLSPGLYNNLTPTLLPASVTISHSIQPLDSQGRPWSPDIFDRIHLLFTQVHFFFWQLGRLGGQYATQPKRGVKEQDGYSTSCVDSFLLTNVLNLEPIWLVNLLKLSNEKYGIRLISSSTLFIILNLSNQDSNWII